MSQEEHKHQYISLLYRALESQDGHYLWTVNEIVYCSICYKTIEEIEKGESIEKSEQELMDEIPF